jgi:hypothetical protein
MTDITTSTDLAARICWHEPGRDCGGHHDNWPKFFYGRCRSGHRWFWAVIDWGNDFAATSGRENTEAAALAAARETIRKLANGRAAAAFMVHDVAREHLKEVNRAKLAARPAPDSSAARTVEYLYAPGGCSDDGENFCPCHKMRPAERWNFHLLKFQITKKTKQRIYYKRQPLDLVEREGGTARDDYGIAYVNRRKIEQDGEIWSHARGGWWEPDCRLYLTPPPLPEWKREPEAADLQKLKADMAAAHPDRGGSNAAFLEARKRYVHARRRVRGGRA